MTEENKFISSEDKTEEGEKKENQSSSNTPDIAVLMKRFEDSQQFIEQLKKENSELREKQKEQASLQQLLEKMDTLDSRGKDKPQQDSQVDFRKLMRDELVSYERERVFKQNKTSVDKALVQKFGDKTEQVISEKAQELGVTIQDLVEISKKSPALILSYFEINKESKSTLPPQSTVKSSAFNQKPETERKSIFSPGLNLMDEWRKSRPQGV